MTQQTPAAESIARAFHERYEKLAPEHGYETRQESAVPFDQVPENNRELMIAVVRSLLEDGIITAGAAADSLEEWRNRGSYLGQ